MAELADGQALRLKSFSMVNLIPLFAVEVLESEELERVPEFRDRLRWLIGTPQRPRRAWWPNGRFPASAIGV